MSKYLLFATAFPFLAVAAPACVAPDAKNVVIASSASELADGHSAKWRIESVDGARQVILKRCSERHGDTCYFAVDIEPGRYYFKEVIPGAYNHLQYTGVSTGGMVRGQRQGCRLHWRLGHRAYESTCQRQASGGL